MDVRREDRVVRFKPMELVEAPSYADHVNALGMICSLLGLLMKLKWAAWSGVYCSVVYLANGKATDDKKQTLSLLMLSLSSLVMVYMQNPSPISAGT